MGRGKRTRALRLNTKVKMKCKEMNRRLLFTAKSPVREFTNEFK